MSSLLILFSRDGKICTVVAVTIKGTACGLYNIEPLSGHSLHKLQPIYPQLGSYTTLWQLYHNIQLRAVHVEKP